MKQRILHRLFCMLLAVALVFSFSACRQSPVLQQVQYVEHAEADPNQQQRDNNESHTLPDQEIAARTEQTTASRRENQDDSKAKKGDENNAPNQSAAKENYDQAGQNRDEAAQGAQTQPNNNGQNNNSPAPTPENNGGGAPTPGQGPEEVYQLPENIDKVLALGDAALYVEILGGRDRLASSSESVLQNHLYGQLLYPQGKSFYPYWSGDVNNPAYVSQNGESLADALHNTEIGAIIYDATQTNLMNELNAIGYTADPEGKSNTSYLNAMNSKGEHIALVPLPAFNTTQHMMDNAAHIGQVLGYRLEADGSRKEGGARDKANEYNDWVRGIISEVGGRNHTFTGPDKIVFDQDSLRNGGTDQGYAGAGAYTILLDDWNPTLSYSTSTMENLSGSGMATARSGNLRTESPASFFISLGGAANTAVLFQDIDVFSYAVSPTPLAYVNPLPAGPDYQNAASFMTRGMGNGTSRDGNPFNTILVSSDAAKATMTMDPLWRGTNSDTNLYGAITPVTNPFGIGDWKRGSPESPLEAIFASMVFSGDFTQEELHQRIREFYAQFFGITPDDAVLWDILNGEDSLQPE